MRKLAALPQPDQLLTITQALDYPGSYGAVCVVPATITGQHWLVPKHLVLRQGSQYCFTTIGAGVGRLLDYAEVESYAKFIKKAPDGPVWLALVG